MRFLLSFAWRDLRGSARALWVFCACLALGVALVAAGGGLFRQIGANLQAEARSLFGGDLEVRASRPLAERELAWIEERAAVSLLVEMRTMLRTPAGRTQLVELQSADANYPLYGKIEIDPPGMLASALAYADGTWGAVIDGALARRLELRAGDRIALGGLDLVVRAIAVRQPDRSLRADWRGPPVLIAAGALAATRLVQPGSRLAYRYRIRTDMEPAAWRAAALAAFPQAEWEIRTYSERSERMTEVLRQIGSGLLLIGFSALFIGGLGVFNSVQSYLREKLATLATLRALGLRDKRLAAVYLWQILMLAGGASLLGTLAGGALALAGIALAAEALPVAAAPAALAAPLALAWLFGMLTAITFALPALGRAVSVSPAALFQRLDAAAPTARGWWWLTAAAAGATTALLVVTMPDPRFGAGFVLAIFVILALLEALVRLLRRAARRLNEHSRLAERFELRLAAANLYRPGSPLRAALLSLGSALTVLVASTLVVAALLRTIDETVPENAPALVFYDVQAAQIDELRAALRESPGLEHLALAPFVLGRLTQVNGLPLRDSADVERALEAREEHKLSDRRGNFDDVVIARGAWWPTDYRGPPLVAMEDREADQAGVALGDRLRFDIMGSTVEARVAAIYSQRRYQSRLWLEAIFSDGVLDPYITRYVGAAYMAPGEAASAQDRIAAAAPNIVTVRTEALLGEARALLARAGAGLSVIAGVTLIASLLVLASVVAASLARQVYQASVLNVLGARVALIRRSLQVEYAVLALLTSAFSIVAGSALAAMLLHFRLDLEAAGLYWIGAATALLVSTASLGLGATYLLRQLRIAPAQLLRSGG